MSVLLQATGYENYNSVKTGLVNETRSWSVTNTPFPLRIAYSQSNIMGT